VRQPGCPNYVVRLRSGGATRNSGWSDETTGSITILQSPDGTVGANNPARSSDKIAVQDGLLFNALREGDKVMFISQKINGVNTITKLQKE
jgi:Cu/Ag efflux protein CusF